MAKIFDNISFLLNPDKEEEDIAIFRVTEKEVKQTFPEIIKFKVQLTTERIKRKRKYYPIQNLHLQQKS